MAKSENSAEAPAVAAETLPLGQRPGLGPAPANPGPVFIAGRQHSGNTVLAVMLSRLAGCYSQIDENGFFEIRSLIDREADPARRAAAVARAMKIEAKDHAASCEQHLLELARTDPRADALTLYRAGMAFLTERQGLRFWSQKATSYIFYGREILSAMPEARLIYMVRSPYDIAASKKRRARGREYVFGTMVGWNKGMRIARELAAGFPDRFRMVRYEDLTGRPEETARAVASFLGVPFDPACLDVPHVNKSETGYSLTGDGKGLNRSRVNYYTSTLSAVEITALDMLRRPEYLRDTYPDLPHLRPGGDHPRPGAATRAQALLMVAWSPFWFLWDYATRLPRSPWHLLVRTLRRLKK